MPTVNLQIGADANDGVWGGGAFSQSATVFGDAGGGTNPRNVWLRFTSVTIPQGSTITAATLTVKASADGATTTCTIAIKAVAEDSPTAPTDATDAAGRSTTTASVAWAVPAFTTGTNYSPSDIATVIQEIVNRAGWSSGNALMVYLLNNGSSAGAIRQAVDYFATPADSAKLDITYAASGYGAAWPGMNVMMQS